MSLSYIDFVTACQVLGSEWSALNRVSHREDAAWVDERGIALLRVKKQSCVAAQDRSKLDAPLEGINRIDNNDDNGEEADVEALPRQSLAPSLLLRRTIIYDIIHSTSYQVPVLYISFSPHAIAGKATLPSPDEVYDTLVPATHKAQTKSVGVMGALSLTDHPITDLPAYFVHPCRTAEAMEAVTNGRGVKPEEYLLLWVGLVGPSVGLNVPVEVAQRISEI